MNDIQEGDIIVVIHGDDIIGKIIAEGAAITHPDFEYGKIPSHVTSPICKTDENHIEVILDKYGRKDPEFPDSREWIQSHLYGKPVVGDLWVEEMVAIGIAGGSLKDSGYLEDNNIFVLEPVFPYSPMGLKALSVWSAFYFKKQIPYDYFVYLDYAVEIGVDWVTEKLFNKEYMPWLGPANDFKEGIKDPTQWKQVCVELGERLTNLAVFAEQALNPSYFNGVMPFLGNVNAAQPIDILLNPFYRIKDTSPNQLNVKK